MKRFLLLLATLGLLAATALAEKIDLGSGKALWLTVPETWVSAEMPAPSAGRPEHGRSVHFVTKNGSNDALIVTVLSLPDDRFNDPENLRAMVESALQRFATNSVEGKVVLKELKFGGGTGLAATFTDADLVGKPGIKGDYKAMTSAFVYLGERVMITTTIFTDSIEGNGYTESLRILKSISLHLTKNQI